MFLIKSNYIFRWYSGDVFLKVLGINTSSKIAVLWLTAYAHCLFWHRCDRNILLIQGCDEPIPTT